MPAALDVTMYLNNLLSGCGVESEKIEVAGIIRQIAEEYGRGNISDEEAMSVLGDVCEGIAALAQKCGRSVNVDECVEKLMAIVKQNMPMSSIMGRVMEKLRKKRRSGGGSAFSTGILG